MGGVAPTLKCPHDYGPPKAWGINIKSKSRGHKQYNIPSNNKNINARAHMSTTILTKAKPQIIYAIDPDADKSGIAKLTVSTRRLDAVTMTFPELIDYFRTIMREAEVTNQSYLIVIEAGWLIKTHWHLGKGDSQQYAAAKGNAVGRNHEAGRKLAEMCAHWNMPYKLIKPLPLKIGRAYMWSGKDGKITAAELAEITGFRHRSNQESRDAALIAWVEAGLPTRIKPKFNR